MGYIDLGPTINPTGEAKVDGSNFIQPVSAAAANILKQSEYTLVQRAEIDVPNTTYTVGAGKRFVLTHFSASFDAQPTVYVRLKKQTAGAGSFNTIWRITLEVGGQGQGTIPVDFGIGINIGNAADVFKLTVEATLVKGLLWAGYVGIES